MIFPEFTKNRRKCNREEGQGIKVIYFFIISSLYPALISPLYSKFARCYRPVPLKSRNLYWMKHALLEILNLYYQDGSLPLIEYHVEEDIKSIVWNHIRKRYVNSPIHVVGYVYNSYVMSVLNTSFLISIFLIKGKHNVMK